MRQNSSPPKHGLRSESSPELIKRALERYRPESLRLLFIAEAPPAYKANRLFYFTEVETGDALFLEMMKVIYGPEVGFTEGEGFANGQTAKAQRRRKSELLDRFMADGYFLIDASVEPMPDDATSSVKLALLRKSLPDLMTRVKALVGDRICTDRPDRRSDISSLSGSA